MSVDFEPAMVRTSSYLDGMDASPFMLDGSAMDYLQYDQAPGSPAFGAGVNLSSSPHIDYNIQLPGAMGVMEPFGYTFGARSYSPGADSASISPPTLSYHLSAGETSDDSSRRSRGENPTPPPVPYAATVPRSHRFNPIQVPATRASTRAAASRRRGSRSSMSNGDLDSDAEEEEDYQPSTTGGPDLRREAVRRQRIESEQRRRDELREGYARLKAVLPPSSAKSSKVNLLDRAAIHVKSLEKMKQQADAKLKSAEAELVRVRSLNEVLSLRAVQQREAMSGAMAPY